MLLVYKLLNLKQSPHVTHKWRWRKRYCDFARKMKLTQAGMAAQAKVQIKMRSRPLTGRRSWNWNVWLWTTQQKHCTGVCRLKTWRRLPPCYMDHLEPVNLQLSKGRIHESQIKFWGWGLGLNLQQKHPAAEPRAGERPRTSRMHAKETSLRSTPEESRTGAGGMS